MASSEHARKLTAADSWRLVRASWREWRADKAGQLAAALAFYAVIALAPLLLLAVGVAARFFGEQAAQGQLVQHIRLLVGPEAATALQTVIAGVYAARPGVTATLLGIATFLFGASHLFAQLKDALNLIWQVRRRAEGSAFDWLRTRTLAVISVLGSGIVLGFALSIESATTLASQRLGLVPHSLWGDVTLRGVTLLLSFSVICLLSAVIYKALPDATIAWRDVWIGAAVTAALLIAGQGVIGWFLRNSQLAAAYGVVGSMIVLLIWVYASSQIVLFGAEFTRLYADRYGSRVAPAADAIVMVPPYRTPKRSAQLD